MTQAVDTKSSGKPHKKTTYIHSIHTQKKNTALSKHFSQVTLNFQLSFMSTVYKMYREKQKL